MIRESVPNISFDESKCNLRPLQEEASTRRYFLIESGINSQPDGEIPMVICKDNTINWDFIELSEFLRKQGIRVPKVHSIDSEKNIILQEYCGMDDLSSLSLQEYQDLFPQLLEIILSLQSLSPPPIVKNRRFDYEKLFYEINLTLEAYQYCAKEYELHTGFSEEMVIFLQETCEYLHRHPDQVFTHRDYHCRNLLKGINRDELVLIDFQDARMGTPQYDLCSILYDAYKPLPRDFRITVLDDFQKKHPNKNFYRFKETYYLQALQRSFKALGTYLIQVAQKKNPKFRPSLFSCLDNLMEISQLGHFPDSIYVFAYQLSKEIKLKI